MLFVAFVLQQRNGMPVLRQPVNKCYSITIIVIFIVDLVYSCIEMHLLKFCLGYPFILIIRITLTKEPLT